MVRKLYRHEAAALFKWVLPICALSIAVTLLHCAMVEVNNCLPDNIREITDVFLVLLMMTFISMLYVLSTVVYVLVLVRFYKHLLGSEGYLTFSLPVTPTTHLVCKLLCGIVAQLVSSAVTLVCGYFIVTTTIPDYVKGFGLDLLTTMLNDLAGLGFVVFVIIFVIYLIVSIFHSLLMPYTAMCVGQLAKRRKIPMAILWYFIFNLGVNTVTQLTGVVSSFVIFGSESMLSRIGTASEIWSMSLSMIMYTLPMLALSIVFFLVSKHILNHKLNLE